MTTGSNDTRGFRWTGLFGSFDRLTRVAAQVILMLLALSMILTQTAFFRVGDVHVLGILAPIVLLSFLFGPLRGTLCGFLSGVALMLHALYMPLDYYERYFALPLNSVVLLTLVGTVSGLALSAILGRVKRRGARIAAYAVLAVVISTGASVVCRAGVTLVNYVAVGMENIPDQLVATVSSTAHEVGQAGLGALLVFAVLCLAEFVGPRLLSPRSERSMSSIFKIWLALLVVVSFLMASGITFAVSTAISLNNAHDMMNGQISYVVRQLAERDSWYRMMQASKADAGTAERVYAQSVTNVASDMQLMGTGVVLVADNDQIVSANQAGYEGKSLTEVLEEGLIAHTTEEVFSSGEVIEYYLGNSADIAYVCGRRSSYMRSTEYGSYQVIVALESSDVFATRSTLMVVIQCVCLLIFLFIYGRTARLLDTLVVASFRQTNDTLDRITAGDLDQRVDVTASSEFATLSKGVNTMVGALKESIQEAETRYDRELATAKAIQASALPSTFPPFPQIEYFDLFATMRPAKEVGGDFYDFFLIGDDKLGFLIADVSGKGIPAALFMMTSKTQIANCIESGMSLEKAVETANHHLCQGNEANMFVTAWMGVLDYKTGHLTYVNAGHNPPLLRHDGEWTWLRNRSGFILGSFDGMSYERFEMDLVPGDMLFLYTDGVNEATDANDALYGDERMENFLSVNARLGPRACIMAMTSELMAFQRGVEQADDITMLALAYGVAPEVAGRNEFPATTDKIMDVRTFVDNELTRRLCPMDKQAVIDRVLKLVCQKAIELAPDGSRMRVGYVYTTNPASFTVEVMCPGEPYDFIDAAEGGDLGFDTSDVDDIACVRGDDNNVFVFRVCW